MRETISSIFHYRGYRVSVVTTRCGSPQEQTVFRVGVLGSRPSRSLGDFASPAEAMHQVDALLKKHRRI